MWVQGCIPHVESVALHLVHEAELVDPLVDGGLHGECGRRTRPRAPTRVLRARGARGDRREYHMCCWSE